MATASTSPLSLSPTFSTSHYYQWPADPRSQHYPSHHSHHDYNLSFELPVATHSFGQLTRTALSAAPLSSPSSADDDCFSQPPASHLSPLSASPSASSLSSGSIPPATTVTAERANGRRRRRQDAEEETNEDSHSTTSTHDAHAARRLKHRQIDAHRRAREQAAVNRLLELTTRLTRIPHFDEQHSNRDTKRRRTAEEKKDKVTALEEAADRMEQLYELIEQLGEACTAQYDHSRALMYQHQAATRQPFPDAAVDMHTSPPAISSASHTVKSTPANDQPTHMLSLLPAHPAGAKQIEAATSRQSLYSAFFLSASLPMLTVRCDTGHVLDVNSRVLSLSGWQPHHIIGKRINGPYSLVMRQPELSFEETAAIEAAYSASERVLVDSSDESEGDCMVHTRHQQQYPQSHRLERRLYAGEESVITAVWRVQLRNGRLHEITATQWCGGWVEQADGQRQPSYMVYMIAPESVVCVD